MAEIINLNKARKHAARIAERRDAAANRAAHGVPKIERDHAEAERDRLDHALDAAKRDAPDDGPG